MKNKDIRIESLTEILETLGVSATPEQISQIVEDFSLHIEMEHEMESYQHVGYVEPCKKCSSLQYELNAVKKERDIYHKNVCQRRKTEDVWIEGDTVMFRPN
jgi:hypothetical protein